ncbi:hypothetical protein BX600DRAFT_515740 [Xylariales sp. PMI_506]|nr:hypothetical protein BX600DRAFT_515740 [Xylariales sp. PMI_506]
MTSALLLVTSKSTVWYRPERSCKGRGTIKRVRKGLAAYLFRHNAQMPSACISVHVHSTDMQLRP